MTKINKYDLKQAVIELLIMVANINPGYEDICRDILDDMAKWDKPKIEHDKQSK